MCEAQNAVNPDGFTSILTKHSIKYLFQNLIQVCMIWLVKEIMNMAKLTFKTDKCKGCGLCIDACPKGLIKLAADKINQKGYHPAEITDESACVGCAACAMMCPDCIIKVER